VDLGFSFLSLPLPSERMLIFVAFGIVNWRFKFFFLSNGICFSENRCEDSTSNKRKKYNLES